MGLRKENTEILKVANNRSFYLEFENGYSISVAFGESNYCDNRILKEVGETENVNRHLTQSSNAELWIQDSNGKSIGSCGDAVIGWVSATDIGKIIGLIANATSRDKLVKQINEVHHIGNGICEWEYETI
jgi:hypothetical protein